MNIKGLAYLIVFIAIIILLISIPLRKRSKQAKKEKMENKILEAKYKEIIEKEKQEKKEI